MSILTMYHDCDQAFTTAVVAVIGLLLYLMAVRADKRARFARYEQHRRRYSEWRMRHLDEVQ